MSFLLSFARLVSVGNLEAAVNLLLSTPPESSYFYVNALRAVALSSAISRSLHELAVKVSLLLSNYLASTNRYRLVYDRTLLTKY